MRRLCTALLACAIAVVITTASCSSGGDDFGTIPPGFSVTLQLVSNGLQNPVYLTAPPDDPRLFIVEKSGRVRIIQDGDLLGAPFLDLASRVSTQDERGVLGLVFHPSYGSNGTFFVSFTDLTGAISIERYTVSASDANVANAASASLVLRIEHPRTTHNGGAMLFAPDGTLMISTGDGGSNLDMDGHAQNRNSLLGKILRIDVSGSPYSVPSNNPFVGQAGARGEVWALGLRNPWRFAIDRVSQLAYISDVGEQRSEEVNVVPLNGGGANFGWSIVEGNRCVDADNCDTSQLTSPVHTHDHPDGCSVIGGYVYRGAAMPEIRGHYFYSDFCGGWLRSFRYSGGSAVDRVDWNTTKVQGVSSLGQDAAGELYILSIHGPVHRIIKAN